MNKFIADCYLYHLNQISIILNKSILVINEFHAQK